MTTSTSTPITLRRFRHRRTAASLIASLGAAALILAPPAHGGENPHPGSYHYSVSHSLFGDIGQQTIRLSRRGPDVIVTMEARVKIRFLYMTVLQLHTRGREIWRDGRMIAFDGRSEEDGDITTISARRIPSGMMVHGPRGKTKIAGPLALTNPWKRGVLDAPVIIEPTSGSLLSVKSSAAGNQSIKALGRAMDARKYVVTGDMEADVWFTKDGVLGRMEFFRAGGRVTIALESFTPFSPFPRGLVAEQTP